MKTVNVTELDGRFDELLDLTEQGEEIIIIRDGQEIGRLLPPRHYAESVPIPMRGFGQ